MVDRYILPVPKTKSFQSYVRLKNTKANGLNFLIPVMLLCYQMNRYFNLRRAGSKPGNYYLDWGHRDAPGKVRYFSS